MNMKAPFLYISLSLSLSLVACTPQQPLPLSASQPTTANPAIAQQSVTYTYRAEPTFGTQAVDTSALKYIRLSLVGSGISGTLNGELVPVTSGTFTARLNQVPLQPGELRVVTVQGYDSDQNPLSAFVGKGYYLSRAGVTNVTVSIDRRQLVTGRILERLLASQPSLAKSLNLAALQSQVETATGYDANTEHFATDPLLFQIDPLVTLLQAGNALTSDDLTTAQLNLDGNVSVTLKTQNAGYYTEQALTLTINDPHSQPVELPLFTADNSVFHLNVAPGDYTVSVKTASGAIVASGTVSVDAAGVVGSAPILQLTGVAEAAVLPTVTVSAVDKTAAAPGETLTLTGTNLQYLTQVSFNGVAVTQFASQSPTSLRVVVPANATDGPLSITRFGQGEVVNNNFDILRTLFVNPEATGTADGSSYVNGYLTLEAALAAANPQDTIRVLEGTYSPASTLQLKAGVRIFGGFDKLNPEFELAQRNLEQNPTILDGQQNKVLAVTTGSGVVLDGLRFTQGRNTNGSGGALRIDTNHQLTAENLQFLNNRSSANGGAIQNLGTLQMTKVLFSQNRAAQNGGAIENTAQLTASDVNFQSNQALEDGGAISNIGTVTLTEGTFENNQARSGGAINNSFVSPGGTLNLSRSLFKKNVAIRVSPSDGPGGGAILSTANGKTLTLSELTLIENSSSTRGGAIDSHGASTVNLSHSTLAQNTAPIGGGIYMHNNSQQMNISQSVLALNTARRNTAPALGGGIRNIGATLGLVNVAFVLNQAISDTGENALGGGLYCTDSQGLRMINTSFIKNSSQSAFGGSFSAGADIFNTPAVVRNSLFWNNGVSGLSGLTGTANANGNINLEGDSPFLSAFTASSLAEAQGPDGLWFTADDGYLLKPEAQSLIDQGVDVASDTQIDLLGNPRAVEQTVANANGNATDIGVHEVQLIP
jgi:predicted outer membrane repeat protein